MKNEKGISVFFDTEFTSINPHVTPNLISIGCISADGREFYAELTDTYHLGECSDFVIKTVLPLLEGGEYRMQEAQLAIRLKSWVESLGENEVVFRSDAPGFDWPFVAEMFQFHGCWPANLRRKCGTIYWENERFQHRYNAGMESYWKDHSQRQHHAMVDARSLRFSWKFAIKRGM